MCLNPIIAYHRPFHNKKDKFPAIEIIGNARKYIKEFGQNDFFRLLNFTKEYDNSCHFRDSVSHGKYILLPCRHCSECVKNKTFEWSVRNIIENQFSTGSVFITLTYDNDHLHFSKSLGLPTLYKNDVVAFMKALRQYYSQKFNIKNIRFFDVGEYGSISFRPHYHILLYNVPLDTLKLKIWSNNGKCNIIYRSEVIEKFWKNGISTVQENNDYSIRYTSGYVQKKMLPYYKICELKELGFTAEYNNMSRRPGIGFQEYDNYKNMKFNDVDADFVLKYGTECLHLKNIKFFENKLKNEDTEESYKYIRSVKERITPYIDKYNEILSNTDKDLSSYWEEEDRIFFDNLKCKRRLPSLPTCDVVAPL